MTVPRPRGPRGRYTALPEPAEFSTIFDKPGARWSPSERARVTKWLNCDPQRASLVRDAEANLQVALGTLMEDGDGEYAWQEYNTPRKDDIRPVDRHVGLPNDPSAGAYAETTDGNGYDPAKGLRFPIYLPKWFAWFCTNNLARTLRHEREPKAKDDPLIVVERETEDGEYDDKAYDDLVAALADCFRQLPDETQTLVKGRVEEEMSFREIGEALELREVTTRVRYFRALQQLARCLVSKGYGELLESRGYRLRAEGDRS
jgi:RNA polymerase sigma factor (sigma-70 family)